MMHQKHKGAASEVIALLWLLNEGYEVYRNVSAFGICDLVAIKGEEILKIDVKTGCIRKNNKKQRFYSAGHTLEQLQNNVKILMVDLQKEQVHGWLEPRSIESLSYICICGKVGKKVLPYQKFCSYQCRKNNFNLLHKKEIT